MIVVYIYSYVWNVFTHTFTGYIPGVPIVQNITHASECEWIVPGTVGQED